MKQTIILGGPNGAGKTTAALAVLLRKFAVTEFVNADEIALGLSRYDPESAALDAGRSMLRRLHFLAAGEQSFAFETTCSGRGHLRFLAQCKASGWQLILLFLWLPSPEAAIDRVALRIRNGGHSIPPEIITRRYWAGLRNMREFYLPIADVAAIYDNSGPELILVAEKASNGLAVRDADRWTMIERT